MKEKCKYIKASGYNVLCSKKSVVLGDIIGYSGQRCEKCEFYQPTETKAAAAKPPQNRRI